MSLLFDNQSALHHMEFPAIQLGFLIHQGLCWYFDRYTNRKKGMISFSPLALLLMLTERLACVWMMWKYIFLPLDLIVRRRRQPGLDHGRARGFAFQLLKRYIRENGNVINISKV